MTTPEWLEPDGNGGFASGPADGIRTRRYHALLLADTPRGRMVLVNGLEAWVQLPAGPAAISTQRYAPGILHPDGAARLTAFEPTPWPRWVYALPDGSHIVQEFVAAANQVSLRWTRHGAGPATLHLRPLLSGRFYHALHAENPAFDFTPHPGDDHVTWRPYPGVPPIAAWGGAFHADPLWFRQFLYTEERVPRPRLHRGPGLSRRALLAARHPRLPHPPRRRRPAPPRPRAVHRRARPPPRPRPAAQGRRLLQRRRRRARHHRRRLPLVHRLGPRHLHRAARPAARHRPAPPGRARPASPGPPTWTAACSPTASPTAPAPPSSTPSTPACGSSSPSMTCSPQPIAPAPRPSAPPASPSSTATPTAPATASAWTRTAWCTPGRRACS